MHRARIRQAGKADHRHPAYHPGANVGGGADRAWIVDIVSRLRQNGGKSLDGRRRARGILISVRYQRDRADRSRKIAADTGRAAPYYPGGIGARVGRSYERAVAVYDRRADRAAPKLRLGAFSRAARAAEYQRRAARDDKRRVQNYAPRVKQERGKPRSLKHGARGHSHAGAAQEDKLDVRAAAVGKNIWEAPALAVLAVIADAPVVCTVAPRGAAVGLDRRSGGNGQIIGKIGVNGVSRSVRRAVRQGKNIGVAGAGKLKLRADLQNTAGAAGKTVFFCKHIASVRA